MRRLAPSLVGVLALVGLVLAFPPAAAQAGETAVFKVRVVGPEEPKQIRQSLGSTDLQFTITFLCKVGDAYEDCSGQGQLEDQKIEVTLEETRKPQYPTGWKVEVQQLSPFVMDAGDQKIVEVKVSLLSDDPEKDTVRVELRATAKPQPNEGVTGLLPGQVTGSQSTNAAHGQSVEKVLTFAENIESLTRDYKVPLIGGAVVLLLGAAILARGSRKKGTLSLTSDAPTQVVMAGRGASFPVRLENQTREDDRVRLRTSHLPAGWISILPLDEVDLRAGEQTQLWVTLRAPARAVAGQSLTFELRAISTRETGVEAKIPLQVTVGSASEGLTNEPVEEPSPAPAPEDYELELPPTTTEEAPPPEPSPEPPAKKARRKARSSTE